MSRIGWDYPEDNPEHNTDEGTRGRLAFLQLFILLVFGLLLYRVIWLQQIQGGDYTLQAEDNQIANLTIDSPRGVVFDRNGKPLAENLPSFNVTITPAFLPDDPNERQAVFERLSLLTGVPVTNTLEQRALLTQADPNQVGITSQLAELFSEDTAETLDKANIVPQLPQSIAGTVETFSFAQFLPAVITDNVPITMAYAVELESTYLPGVRIIESPLRNYPAGEYTAHLLGYMGPLPDQSYRDRGYDPDDRVGWAGVEYWLEDELAGEKGLRVIEVDWTGRERRQIGLADPPTPGQNIHLTIDLDLQILSQKILAAWLEVRRNTPDRDEITGALSDVEVEQGVVVAMNPNTGEILAMVNLPNFDNNRFANEVPVDYYLGLARNDYTPLLNHAIGGIYPPGSVYKLITAAGAMQEGIVSPERLLDAPGDIIIPNQFAPEDPGRAQQFVCWRREGHGLMNAWGAMANSCDIYFYKVNGGFDQDGETVEALGDQRMYDYATAFGLGTVQGIELPGEAAGLIPTAQWKRTTKGEGWSTGDNYNVAIGQGAVVATPLQIANMAAVVANRGFLYRPTVVHHITDDEGNIVQPFAPEVLNAVPVDREYLDVIAEGMYLVTQGPGVHPQISNGGTAASQIWLEEYGINVAGKTGTAEYCDNIAIQRRWCRVDQVGVILPTHSWYVGYAPYENPEIVVVAFIYNGGEGSRWAAPVVRDVMEAYFGVGKFAGIEDPLEFDYIAREEFQLYDIEVPSE